MTQASSLHTIPTIAQWSEEEMLLLSLTHITHLLAKQVLSFKPQIFGVVCNR